MIKNYPYLRDINFLNLIYGQHNKTQYVTITVLDWAERPIEEIQGKVVTASMTVNGDSSVRRTANLSIKIEKYDELYNNTDSLFTINKKVFIEVGLKNNYAHLGADYYEDYPTIWFPFGTMIIQSFSITHDINGINLNLSLSDKMCLLNGDAGGVIPAAVNFESYDTLGPDGDLHTEWIKINRIIPELVNHFGGEDLNKILVYDIEDKIKQVLKWQGTNPVYLFINNTNLNNSFYSQQPIPSGISTEGWSRKMIPSGYDVGYAYTDFVYPGELTASPGDTVCTILDKIKNTLGNHEYYYDVFGNFIFQEKTNNLNTSQWRQIYQRITSNQIEFLPYRYNQGLNHSVYNFNDSEFIITYNNNPQLNMIKNDFIVWGVRKDALDQELPCRYHLAIDKIPDVSEDYILDIPIVFDTSVYDGIRRGFPAEIYNSLQELKTLFPLGVVGKYYIVGTGEKEAYTWVKDINEYQQMYLNFIGSGQTTSSTTVQTDDSVTPTEVVPGYVKLPLATCYGRGDFIVPKNTDWRDRIYFQGLKASLTGTDTGYYWAEMCNEWPKVYDVENHSWYETTKDNPSSIDWWLDFIDEDSVLDNFSVNSIGRRSYAKTDSECNCVFEPDIPDLVMVHTNSDEAVDVRSKETKRKLKELGLIPIQVNDAIYNSLLTGGTFNSCYQHVRQLLTEYTDYNENISITCLPIYHLEPNTRISLNDPESGIQGDYLINSISFDLSERGTMTISAKKCIEKI